VKTNRRWSWILAWLVAAGSPNAFAQTDVLSFHNGDRLTGEVKSLERGKLRFKTAATDTISIEWEEVAHLNSNQNIQVETQDGRRFLGHLSGTAEEDVVTVETASGPVELEVQHVVLMTPIEARGISRLDGDITAGFNFTKASEIEQLLLGLDLDLRTETRILSVRADVSLSDSQDSESSQRQNFDFKYNRLWPNHWLTGALISLERNDELDLNLRTSVGGGGGRILRQSNQSTLVLEGGLMLSRENVSGSTSDVETIEAFGTLSWDWFRFDTPELDLSTTIQAIPNLTDTGRMRGELDIELKWEMIEDLFWDLSIYNSFDSDPVVDGAEKNDYGISTSLGWSF
jgi:hypothetical protein